MSDKRKAKTLRRKNQRDNKKFSNCFLTEGQLLEKDMKELFLNPQRKRLEHKPKQEIGGVIPLSINMIRTYQENFAMLTIEQKMELQRDLTKILNTKQRQLFHEILIRKYFMKDRSFEDALNSAKEVFDDKYIDSIATDYQD